MARRSDYLALFAAALLAAAASDFLTPPETAVATVERGLASYYADAFDGRPTANGERFDMRGMTAAHRTLPFGTRLRVTNVANGRSAVVRINDRGPFVEGRVLDLSYGAACELRLVGVGVGSVRFEVLPPAQRAFGTLPGRRPCRLPHAPPLPRFRTAGADMLAVRSPQAPQIPLMS